MVEQLVHPPKVFLQGVPRATVETCLVGPEKKPVKYTWPTTGEVGNKILSVTPLTEDDQPGVGIGQNLRNPEKPWAVYNLKLKTDPPLSQKPSDILLKVCTEKLCPYRVPVVCFKDTLGGGEGMAMVDYTRFPVLLSTDEFNVSI